MFTILLSVFNCTEPGNHSLFLNSGIYNITVIGAQGGKGCSDEKEADASGGHGAKITGIIQLNESNEYNIVVGSQPVTNCSLKFQQGSKFGFGGSSGTINGSSYNSGGAGGGFSLIETKDSKIMIAISGGGGGASHKYNGSPAGGINYTYKFSGGEHYEKCYNNCFESGPKGGDGKNCYNFSGTGGGGGAKGGNGGDCDENEMAYGGSSDYNESYFNDSLIFFDGNNNTHTGNGYISIVPIVTCPNNCSQCDLTQKHPICTKCIDGMVISNDTCVNQAASPATIQPSTNTPEEIPSNTTSTPEETAKQNSEKADAAQDKSESSSSGAFGLIGQVPSNQNNKTPLSLIIGIVAGVLILIVAIALAIFFIARSKKDDDGEESQDEMPEETVIYPDHELAVTLDNPLFTTTVNVESDDIFANDFEEGTIERFFIIDH